MNAGREPGQPRSPAHVLRASSIVLIEPDPLFDPNPKLATCNPRTVSIAATCRSCSPRLRFATDCEKSSTANRIPFPPNPDPSRGDVATTAIPIAVSSG